MKYEYVSTSGERLSASKLSKKSGKSVRVIRKRVHNGLWILGERWTREEAAETEPPDARAREVDREMKSARARPGATIVECAQCEKMFEQQSAESKTGVPCPKCGCCKRVMRLVPGYILRGVEAARAEKCARRRLQEAAAAESSF